jgi:hypothetical protein
MNRDIESIIQAEIDGVATADEIARLEAAAAADGEVRALRAEHADIAHAIGRLPAQGVPAGFTDRVMGSLPPPRPSRASVPLGGRIAALLHQFVPVQRRHLALEIAMGVVVTVAIGLFVSDLAQPGTDQLSGTVSARPETTLGLKDGSGTFTSRRIDGGWHMSVTPSGVRPLTIAIRGGEGVSPTVLLDPSGDYSSVEWAGGLTILETERAETVRFQVAGTGPLEVRVESGGEVLLDWTTIPGSD